MRRILFLGRGVIAERCLALLLQPPHAAGLRIEAIVTTPEFYGPASERCAARPRFIPNEGRNEPAILAAIGDLKIDLLLSVQHPWILSGEVLDAVAARAFNLHNAKLPDYKGYNSISHAILNGERSYTTTVHWMSPRVDMGDIAYEESVPVCEGDTAWSLYQKSVEAAVKNFGKLLDDLSRGSEPPRKKITGEGTFYRKGDIQALKEIRSVSDEEEVDRKARAFYFPPFEPAYFVLSGKKFYVSRQPY